MVQTTIYMKNNKKSKLEFVSLLAYVGNDKGLKGTQLTL